MVFPLAIFGPRCEVSHFAVVSVVCQPHLRSYEEDFAIMQNHTAIVDHVLMHNGPEVRKEVNGCEKLRFLRHAHPNVAEDV